MYSSVNILVPIGHAPVTMLTLNFSFRATLTPELKDLVDKFSAFQHSSWVFSLQTEGWVYGPVHQEDRSQHPNLRPYEALCLRVNKMNTGMINDMM